jgi:hypothetical protein
LILFPITESDKLGGGLPDLSKGKIWLILRADQPSLERGKKSRRDGIGRKKMGLLTVSATLLVGIKEGMSTG